MFLIKLKILPFLPSRNGVPVEQMAKEGGVVKKKDGVVTIKQQSSFVPCGGYGQK